MLRRKSDPLRRSKRAAYSGQKGSYWGVRGGKYATVRDVTGKKKTQKKKGAPKPIKPYTVDDLDNPYPLG